MPCTPMREDGAAFQFQGASNLLRSPAGIFRLCFCRPTADAACDGAAAFRAPFGLMTAAGPFQQTTTCTVGSTCTLDLYGIGLHAGDALIVIEGSCGATAGAANLANFMPDQALRLQEEGQALQASFGSIPRETTPGTYGLCWCPGALDCTSALSFRAAAGQVQIDCPEGHFLATSRCTPCGRGFYCPGGNPVSATRFPCPAHETTRTRSARTRLDCECVAGYFLDSGSCAACGRGFYKADPGNMASCDACPQNLTTHLTGSVSNASCVAALDEEGSAPADLDAEGFSNASDVPTVTFNVSLGDWIDPSIRRELITILRRSLADSTRLDPGAVEIILPWAAAGRRLTESSVVILLKFPSEAEASRSAQETDVSVLVGDMSSALQQNADLSGLTIEPLSGPSVSSVTITCPDFSAKPPGVPILGPGDCLCKPGFGFDVQLGSCKICPEGEYKFTLEDSGCEKCESPKSTVQPGAVSVQQCTCGAGMYEQDAECLSCVTGFYCNGTGAAFRCPENSTTISEGSRSLTDCICIAGHQVATAVESSATFCEPCAPGRYKPNLGNGVCFNTCPSNAGSGPASIELDDCYCLPAHVAELDSTGKLNRCASCALYSGLVCPGGFDFGTKNHTQPQAIEGWFQSGKTLAFQCLVVLPDGRSVCRGGTAECQQERDPSLASLAGCQRFGNQCAEGSAGMICGECPVAWARGNPLEYCQPCPLGQGAALLVSSVTADIARITVVNFVIAVLAAKGAGTSLKLHTSMIRIVQSWIAACAILLNFDLDRLEAFSWSEAQGCDQNCPEPRLMWPQAVSDAMRGLFSLLAVLPRTSVNFAAACQAEDMLPGNPTAKRMIPALYYLALPPLTLASTVLLCACVVYIAVPLGKMLGLHFNDAR